MAKANAETLLDSHKAMDLPSKIRVILDSFEADKVPPILDQGQQTEIVDFFSEQDMRCRSGASAQRDEETTTRALAEMAMIELTLPYNVAPEDWGMFIGPHIFIPSGGYYPHAVMVWQPGGTREQDQL